ncbi:C4-dicarboxylic acid transporter DauA [Sulfurirhabdus autotrophica]|uniref:SulP family sulfate permease n=1 Tax=Sulfurirhabdus autotrophica TaxID=1706046 RepID=A0A4R3YI43_9PROT|nr:C4-dicarboxylic acid transporter DauA [Sulfurirhabdus autotrophica]TCV90293.1 SulP family sulfate permease [Sulfurirhabdus autotrophica]
MFSAIKKSVQHELSLVKIQSNILAGLTVGVIALPLSMALAIASGVPPQHGLYTAIVAGIVIALTGGSQVNISGPTAAFVVVLLPIVQLYGFGGLLVSGFLAGVILVLMGVARLGQLIEIVPYPVTVGFTAGIAVVIATFQIKDFFGLDILSLDGHYVDKLILLIKSLPTMHWQETLIGMITLGILIVWPKMRSRIPGHLVGLIAGSVIAWIFSLIISDFSVATIGSRFHYEINGVTGSGIPSVLPSFEWPWNLSGADGKPIGFSFGLLNTLVASAFTIAVLGALESLLCAVVADGMSGKKHDPNDELIGQGIGNMIAPLFGGIPATAAIARTAASIRAGGSSPISAVVHSLFIILAIILLAPLLAYIPMASMAALLLMVAWNMSETKHFIRTLKIAPKDDIVTLLTCFLLTVLFDMTIAVAVGMGLAAMLFIRRSIDLAEYNVIHSEHEKDVDLPKEIVIYDINGPLFFGSAQKAMKNIIKISPEVRVVILDMSEVTMIDMSAIVAMESILANLSASNVGLVINNLQPRMILKLRRAGVRTQTGKLHFSRSMVDALEKAKEIRKELLL